LKNYIIKGIVTLLAIGICVSISLAAPAAPTGVEVADVPNDDGGSILINWTLSEDDGNVTKYEIFRGEDATVPLDSPIGSVLKGNISYTDETTTNGVHYWYIVNATDGTTSSSSNTSVSIYSEDNKKPEITDVEHGNVTNSTAVITWKTHENSTSKVEYGINSTNEKTKSESLNVTLHKIELEDLDPLKEYCYNVSSTDEAGNTNTVVGTNFTTTAKDTTKPEVEQKVPGNNDNDTDITADITATFSEEMNVSTLDNTSFYIENSSGQISGEVTYDSSTKTATFDPKDDLNYDTGYTATMTTYAEDSAGNSLNEITTWSFTTEKKEASNNPLTATNNSVDPTSGVTPVTFYFYVTFTGDNSDSLESVKLYIDNEFHDDMSVVSSSNGKDYVYNKTFSEVGTYEYYFKASDGTDTVESDKDNFTVHPATYYSGNRIWEDDPDKFSDTYKWTPQSFSGFYYDLDTNESSETLTIKNIGRSLKKGEIEYKTKPIPIEFENSRWGTYYVIGYMADRYFAGYNDTDFATSDDNLLSEEKLSRVLTDNDKKIRLNSGSALELEDGYEFKITEFSLDGETIMVGLFKDGDEVSETIVEEKDTYIYEKDLGKAEDMPIIAIYIDNVFIGQESSSVNIEGIFQISDEYIDVEEGDEFGLMEITGVSSSGITMENEDDVDLDKGDDFNLMGKINIIVADNSTLRFAPYVDMTEPGTYELRGTVTNEDEFDWTPYNFEALMYDIDTGEGDETLHLERNGRTVDEKGLTYTINPITKNFEHSNDGWNSFKSIGFMGETYFAGYLKESSFVSDDRSLISEGKLSKILMDEDKKHTLYIGNSLTLEDGYSVRIDEISQDGDDLMLSILKDGDELSTEIVEEGDNLVYDIEVDKTDIPIVVIHIDKAFAGMERSSVHIDGIFQISDSFTSVEKGDTYGIMEVTDTTPSIVLSNEDDDISLDEGDVIAIMGDIKIKVADDNKVRFYPFQEIVVEEPLFLDLDIPDSIHENEEFTISVTSDGDKVGNVSITFNDSGIGSTDSNGELIYTPTKTGKFKVTASKSGYKSDSDNIEVLYQPKALEINAPSMVDKGKTIVISITHEGEGVSGVTVMFGSNDLGTTPASGEITYTPDQIGTHTITASKSGYQDASKDIDITDPSVRPVYSNLTIEPKRVEPGEKVNITVIASNLGTFRDTDTMTLKVNGEGVMTKDLDLGPGESTTIEYSLNRSKSGTYLVEVDEQSDTFKVTSSLFNPTTIAVLAILAILFAAAIIYSFARGILSFGIIKGKAQGFEESLRRLKEK